MKSKLSIKLLITACLCAVALLTFTACKDKSIYAEKEDFESYPEYWNAFNESTPENGDTSTQNSGDKNTSNNITEDGVTVDNSSSNS